jgi:hypothetical protein
VTSGRSGKTADASRRTVLAAGAAAGTLLLAGRATRVLAEPGPVQTIRLKPGMAERQLPARLMGYNTPGTYIPYDMPDYVPALKALGPQWVRFPGGTVGNYYDWHTGFMEVPDAGAGAGVYRKHLVAQAVPLSKRLHPKGIWVEEWQRIADAIDANLIIEANLETSTPEDQKAWFVDMQKKGVSPKFVEMGTEFFLAMRDDMGRARFPDPGTTTALTKSFVDAIRPTLPADAKIAVQASSAAFELSGPPKPNADITMQRIWAWDQALKSLPWFDAVTMHLYPGESRSAGLDLMKQLPGNAEAIFDSMVARADGGFDRAIDDVAQRVPDKEIWISEYGGFDPAQTFSGMTMQFNGLWFHQITRELFSLMRHPQVRLSCYHAANTNWSLMGTFETVGDTLKPVNAAGVQSWFFHASRGPGCTWQRMAIDGATKVSAASGLRPGEIYWDVDAGIFRNGAEHTLFIHNASKTARAVDLGDIVAPQVPLTAETMATPDLMASFEDGTPVPQPLAAKPALVVPAYSITKVTWSA